MKPHWQRWSRRINAMSLRERVIMAASLAAALAAVADFLILSPQFTLQKGLLERARAEGRELNALRLLLEAPMPDTPAAQARRALSQVREELGAVDEQISQRLAGHADAAQLPDLLRRVLRRHERLALLELEAVPPSVGTAVSRRSVDLQLAGRYADLQAYAQAIERELPGLRWAQLDIDGRRSPPLMSARVWLVGAGT